MNASRSDVFEFRSGGLGLVGERWGRADSRRLPVVFLHGAGQTRHSWKTTARRVSAAGRTAIALDSRGHGDSEWDPAGNYKLDAFVGDLLVFLDQLGRPAILVGASWGGNTALLVAAQRPDFVGGLTLVDVVPRLEPAGVKRIRDFMASHVDGFDSLADVADALSVYNPLRPRSTKLEGLRKNVRLGDDGRWHWHWDPAFMGANGKEQGRDDAERLTQAARRVAAPTLIVRGGLSDVVSETGVRELRERIPGAELADVVAAGHMVAGDDNEVFSGALNDFLTRLQ